MSEVKSYLAQILGNEGAYAAERHELLLVVQPQAPLPRVVLPDHLNVLEAASTLWHAFSTFQVHYVIRNKEQLK